MIFRQAIPHAEGIGLDSINEHATLPNFIRISSWSTSWAEVKMEEWIMHEFDSILNKARNGETENTRATQLSSTSPHLAIWLRTSTLLALLASSTVILPSTNANEITNDFVTCTARSNPIFKTGRSLWVEIVWLNRLSRPTGEFQPIKLHHHRPQAVLSLLGLLGKQDWVDVNFEIDGVSLLDPLY